MSQAVIHIEGAAKRRARPVNGRVIAWMVIALSVALLGAMALGVVGLERHHAFVVAEARV